MFSFLASRVVSIGMKLEVEKSSWVPFFCVLLHSKLTCLYELVEEFPDYFLMIFEIDLVPFVQLSQDHWSARCNYKTLCNISEKVGQNYSKRSDSIQNLLFKSELRNTHDKVILRQLHYWWRFQVFLLEEKVFLDVSSWLYPWSVT